MIRRSTSHILGFINTNKSIGKIEEPVIGNSYNIDNGLKGNECLDLNVIQLPDSYCLKRVFINIKQAKLVHSERIY